LKDLVLSRRGGVPVRDQLQAQLELQILSGALAPGQRLPSVRALARRLKVHANTVSAAYRDLQEAGHVRSRRGSGVFVRQAGPAAPEEAASLDDLIRLALRLARRKGFSMPQIRTAVERWLAAAPPERVVIVDPELELGELIVRELDGVVRAPVGFCTLDQLGQDPGRLGGALALALPYHVEAIRRLVPRATVKTVHPRVPEECRRAVLALPAGAIVLLVSHAPTALKLVSVLVRSLRGDAVLVEARPLSRTREWRRLVPAADLVLADALSLESVRRARPRRLLEVRAIPGEILDRLGELLGPPAGAPADSGAPRN
jgi:GntR family transcriptional regulator